MFQKGENLYHHFLSNTKYSQTILKKKVSLRLLFLNKQETIQKEEKRQKMLFVSGDDSFSQTYLKSRQHWTKLY